MKNVKFSRNGVEFEPTKQELKIVLDDFAKQLGEKDSHIADLSKKVEDLEKQIEAKDKLINDYADEHSMLQCKIADLVVKEIKAEDFAIEQLEKVKEWVSDMFNGWKTNQQVNQLTIDGICLALENVGYKIDNQIKELRGQE